ncbi:MAG: cold-shock protein [Sphingomicrobium sp.]
MPPQVVGEGKGIVKFVNPQKGFGFVVRDDGGEDVFVHISAVEQAGLTDLADGQPLEFTLVDRGGRISATNLKIDGEPMAVVRTGGEPREGAAPGGFGGAQGGPQRQLTGEKAQGTVKFFNAMKGFGFIVRDDGGEDVFVHISAVEQAGLADLADGQPLEFTLVDRGGRVSATNLRIDGEPMEVSRGGGGGDRAGPGGAAGAGGPQRQLTGEKASGTVKFFNAMKGFGFISRDDGQPDAFVHISAVERAGMPTINEGDRLEFEIEVDRRGKYAAVNLTPIQPE